MGDTDKKIIVDKKEVTEEELQKIKQDKNIRLHEEAPNTFRTLTRLVE